MVEYRFIKKKTGGIYLKKKKKIVKKTRQLSRIIKIIGILKKTLKMFNV